MLVLMNCGFFLGFCSEVMYLVQKAIVLGLCVLVSTQLPPNLGQCDGTHWEDCRHNLMKLALGYGKLIVTTFFYTQLPCPTKAHQTTLFL